MAGKEKIIYRRLFNMGKRDGSTQKVVVPSRLKRLNPKQILL